MIKHGIALVVSNATFNDSNIIPLPSCIKDGEDMATLLNELGFDIIHAKDLNRNELFEEIAKFISLIPLYETILFYYTGHGLQIDGKNYIVPKDCTIIPNKDILIRTGLVDMDMITNGNHIVSDKINIFILDACRDNPFVSKSLSAKGLAEINTGVGTIISYATSPNSTSVGYNSSGMNSLFTKYLLQHMKKPNIKIEDVFKLVRNDVEKATLGSQIPWENTSLRGEFYFYREEEDIINKKIYKAIRNSVSEASVVMELSDYYRMPIVDVFQRYYHYKMNLPGGIYLTIDGIYNIILERVISLGFYFKYYRWFYKNSPVIMGEFLHEINIASKDFIDVQININIQSTVDCLVFDVGINLPQDTKVGLKLMDKYGEILMTLFNQVTNKSVNFQIEKQERINMNNYKIEIFSVTSSQQPNSVIDKIGEKGKNLIGNNICYNLMGENIVSVNGFVAIG